MFITCRSHTRILPSYEITLSGLTPANRNWLGRNFTRRRPLRWHVRSSANFLCHLPNWRMMAAKRIFCLRFRQKEQCIVSPTSRRPISVKCEHKTWVCVATNFSEPKLRNFPNNRSFIAKKLWFFQYAFGARVLALDYRSRANLSIALYSRGERVVCCPVILFVQGGDWNLQDWKMTDHQKNGGWNLQDWKMTDWKMME